MLSQKIVVKITCCSNTGQRQSGYIVQHRAHGESWQETENLGIKETGNVCAQATAYMCMLWIYVSCLQQTVV